MNSAFLVLLILQITITYSASNGRYNNVFMRHRINERTKRMHKPAALVEDCMYNICEHVENYPGEEITHIIEAHSVLHSYFGGIIEPSMDFAISTRMNPQESIPLCTTKDISVKPRLMEDIDGVKRDIANVGNYSQVLKYQICRHQPGESCYPGNVLDIKTECVQKHNIIKLVAVNLKNKKLEYRKFRIPSTCVCVYTKP